VIIAFFAAGFLWLRRLATFDMPTRFLGTGLSHDNESGRGREVAGSGTSPRRAGSSS